MDNNYDLAFLHRHSKGIPLGAQHLMYEGAVTRAATIAARKTVQDAEKKVDPEEKSVQTKADPKDPKDTNHKEEEEAEADDPDSTGDVDEPTPKRQRGEEKSPEKEQGTSGESNDTVRREAPAVHTDGDDNKPAPRGDAIGSTPQQQRGDPQQADKQTNEADPVQHKDGHAGAEG